MASEWDEFEEESAAFTRNAFLVGIAVALALVAFVHFTGGDAKQPTPIDAATQEDRTELPPTIIASSIKDSPIDRPAGPTAAGFESYVGVYECTVNGQRVVSDRPCGSSAQARTLVVEQPDPRDAAFAQQRLWQARQQQQSTSRSDAAPSDSGRQSAAAPSDDSPSNESACAEIDRAIDQLNARMRQGYTSQEGEWLRARWHALEDQRHALRCGR